MTEQFKAEVTFPTAPPEGWGEPIEFRIPQTGEMWLSAVTGSWSTCKPASSVTCFPVATKQQPDAREVLRSLPVPCCFTINGVYFYSTMLDDVYLGTTGKTYTIDAVSSTATVKQLWPVKEEQR